jgi:NAD(P)H-hydrate repair Nnr-like enzyme with NAD(P)H-hydrate epimerase domain
MPCEIVRAEEMRAIEEVLIRELDVPSIVLMEHAAAGVVRAVVEAGPGTMAATGLVSCASCWPRARGRRASCWAGRTG